MNSSKDFTTNRWCCDLCDRSFVGKIDVTRHIETKHVLLPLLPCDLCGRLIKTRHNLRIHMKKVHNQIVNFERGIQTQQ